MRNIETFPSKQMWQERREENQERRHFCQNCHILFWSEDLDVNIKCQKFQKRRCCISWSAKSENVAIFKRMSNLKYIVCFVSKLNEKQSHYMYMFAFFLLFIFSDQKPLSQSRESSPPCVKLTEGPPDDDPHLLKDLLARPSWTDLVVHFATPGPSGQA